MILLCGIPSEGPLALVRERLEARGLPHRILNQRRFAETALSYTIASGSLVGAIQVGEERLDLEDVSGVYVRLMDGEMLPEVRRLPPWHPERLRCRALHEVMYRWLDLTPARVVNRPSDMGSNGSKPYQGQIIRAIGFDTPDTLITNDPELVLDFHRRHGRIIYKSMSGVRSIVNTLEEEDVARLHRIRWCPTQFQEFVEGYNVRVHTVGDHAVFATKILSEATDYRYALHQVGEAAELQPMELSGPLARQCLELAAELGLALAGIDLKITPAGRIVCFEVNPSPAFSYYECGTGQPIAEAIARFLAGED
jgi:hypothetical protein